MRATLLGTTVVAGAALALAARAAGGQSAREPAIPASRCEGCGAADAPPALGWRARIAPAGEPGTPLVVSGVVYRPDRRTPAAGVLVYAYHTSAAGAYAPADGATGNARRHGRLRGWLRTDAAGRYELATIRPGGYPGRDDPEHIHLTVTPPGGEERWIDSIVFDDDPRLTPRRRVALAGVGGSGVVRLTRDRHGVLRGVRDIVLERWP
jgi:protocatechuate 3,4-dioxygenase beta subunit